METSGTSALDAIKARMAPAAPEAPVQAEHTLRQLPEALRGQLQQLESALAAQAAEPPLIKIDMGPTPENVRVALAAAQAPAVTTRQGDFDTPELRAAVERRCQPMDFGDLVLSGRVLQKVPVLPGKLVVTFQSLVGGETFWVERTVGKQDLDRMSRGAWMIYARLALTLVEVNGQRLPTHGGTGAGTPVAVDDKLFDEKLARVMLLGERIIEMLIVNMTWFEHRVGQLFEDDFDRLKNG